MYNYVRVLNTCIRDQQGKLYTYCIVDFNDEAFDLMI